MQLILYVSSFTKTSGFPLELFIYLFLLSSALWSQSQHLACIQRLFFFFLFLFLNRSSWRGVIFSKVSERNGNYLSWQRTWEGKFKSDYNAVDREPGYCSDIQQFEIVWLEIWLIFCCCRIQYLRNQGPHSESWRKQVYYTSGPRWVTTPSSEPWTKGLYSFYRQTVVGNTSC